MVGQAMVDGTNPTWLRARRNCLLQRSWCGGGVFSRAMQLPMCGGNQRIQILLAILMEILFDNAAIDIVWVGIIQWPCWRKMFLWGSVHSEWRKGRMDVAHIFATEYDVFLFPWKNDPLWLGQIFVQLGYAKLRKPTNYPPPQKKKTNMATENGVICRWLFFQCYLCFPGCRWVEIQF